MTANRLSQCSLRSPSFLNTLGERRIWNAKLFCPCGKWFRGALKRQHTSSSFVAGLFRPGGPITVPRFIVAIVIDAFNAVLSGRTWPHVFYECFIRISPLVAYRNATPTIMTITWRIGIVTAIFHTRPRDVSWGASLTVGDMPSSSTIPTEASTATSVAYLQLPTQRCFLGTAVAFAKPLRLAMLIETSILNYQQSSKPLPSQIFDTKRNCDRISFSHDRTPFTGLVRTARRSIPSGCSHYNTVSNAV